METWEEMLERRRTGRTEANVRRDIRREMWSELGLNWIDFGYPIGDVCFGMQLLSDRESQVFNVEFARRVNERLEAEKDNAERIP